MYLLAIEKEDFFKPIVPQYFGHSNIFTFLRQLNLSSFCRITCYTSKNAYRREMF